MLDIVWNDQKRSQNAFKPWIDKDDPYDIFLYLSAIHLAYASQGLEFSMIRDDIKALTSEAISSVEGHLPDPLSRFFTG